MKGNQLPLSHELVAEGAVDGVSFESGIVDAAPVVTVSFIVGKMHV